MYGYGRNPDAPMTHLQLSSARSLLKTIDEHFGTIVFCRRYLERLGVEKYLLGLNSLVSHDIVRSYGPLNDIDGSHVAQFEHVSNRHCGPWQREINKEADYLVETRCEGGRQPWR